MPNWRHTDEARARIAAANVGRRHTAATRHKIAQANRRRKYKKISAEHRAAISAANKDRLFTIDHCDKISDAHIAYHERVNPPLSPAERHRREKRRVYKRALRARRRAAGS